MAQPTRRYFTALTGLAQNALDEISLQRLLLRPDRAIWEVHGSVGQFDIRLKEIFNQSGRMYSYYGSGSDLTDESVNQETGKPVDQGNNPPVFRSTGLLVYKSLARHQSKKAITRTISSGQGRLSSVSTTIQTVEHCSRSTDRGLPPIYRS